MDRFLSESLLWLVGFSLFALVQIAGGITLGRWLGRASRRSQMVESVPASGQLAN